MFKFIDKLLSDFWMLLHYLPDESRIRVYFLLAALTGITWLWIIETIQDIYETLTNEKEDE